MNPIDLFEDSILVKTTQKNNNSVYPEVDTTLEDTLLAEILDLDPLSPRKQQLHQQIQPTNSPQHTKNKENIPPQTVLLSPKLSIKPTNTGKVRKINPFYSPSKQTKSLVAKDTLRKQLHFRQIKTGFLTHQPTPPSSSHSPSITDSSNR